MWDRNLNEDEIEKLQLQLPENGLLISKNFSQDEIENSNIETIEEDIKIPNSILPYRVEGKMRCLFHEDEGIVGGKFKKGETTARNERRYVLEMQQGKINYKQDGIKQLKYTFVGEEKLTPWAKMLNIEL